LVALDTEFANR
nr:RecName: Full=Antibacterial peptide AN1; AltName: Full=Bacteriocin AN1 [Limosilactobacillus mucosae]